jgi:hypothetical protein
MKFVKSLILSILLIGTGCSTVKVAPAEKQIHPKGDFPGYNNIGLNCPYSPMDELHRKLYSENR